MDSVEAAMVVHDRIISMEPEESIARKIIGYILLQDLPEQEMIRLALCPDTLMQNCIQKIKSTVLTSVPIVSPPISPTVNPRPLLDPSCQFNRFSPPSPLHFPSEYAFQNVSPRWEPRQVTEFPPGHNMGIEDPAKPGYLYTEAAFNSLGIRGSRNSMNLANYPFKTCHYFNKGYCKLGSECKYFHVESPFDSRLRDFNFEDQIISPRALEKLELEIADLLKCRGGIPISIASLPMIYFERYGKLLQADGYLAESQRHGKSGLSLTKLLIRLKNSICLIERPHGQHAVVLAEDAAMYVAEDAAQYAEVCGERNVPGPLVCGSRQIYLTFPADSMFTEEDVSNYFGTFGPVEDVRIPNQQRRMFGFVGFVHADTVKLILSMGNPHYVGGARVLVKPYKEKPKQVERTYQDKFDNPMIYHSQTANMDFERHARWEAPRLRRKQMEDYELALELETRRLSQFQLARESFAAQSCLDLSMNELKVPEGHAKFPSSERLIHKPDALNDYTATSDDNSKSPVNSCDDQESNQEINLPDIPLHQQ